MKGRHRFWRLVRRIFLLALLAFGIGLLLASQAQPDFRPIVEPLSPEKKALIARTPHYGRPEDATYLSFPEWYLVFNPQEYARVLHDSSPSAFPFFRSIGQFWYGYAQVYGIARRWYPFDFGQHLTVMVIGCSTTVEYTIKGLYEGSVGRLSEWAASGHRTPEDDYAAKVAREYGEFIPTEPWFEFPFGHALTGLWSGTAFFGPQFIRKIERKLFLSLEYGTKTIYAGLIRLASRAVYGAADTRVYATVRSVPDRALTDPEVKKIQELSDGSWLITVPHYQGFTDTVPRLADLGVEFEEIAGNDEILLTLVAPSAWSFDLASGKELFSMRMLASPGLKRVAVQAPVKSLSSTLRQIKAEHLQLEHLYDY